MKKETLADIKARLQARRAELAAKESPKPVNVAPIVDDFLDDDIPELEDELLEDEDAPEVEEPVAEKEVEDFDAAPAEAESDVSRRIARARAKLHRKRNPTLGTAARIAETPVLTTEQVALQDRPVHNDVLWTSLMTAVRAAFKHKNVVSAFATYEALAAYVDRCGFPSIVFGQPTSNLEVLYNEIRMLDARDIDDSDTSDESLMLSLVEEFQRLLDASSEVSVSLQKRERYDGYRGQTVDPQIGDVLRGGFNVRAESAEEKAEDAKSYSVAKSAQEAYFVVMHVSRQQNGITVLELARLDAQRRFNPYLETCEAITSAHAVAEGSKKARFVHGDNPNGFIVVSQLRQMFIEVSDEMLELYKERANGIVM